MFVEGQGSDDVRQAECRGNVPSGGRQGDAARLPLLQDAAHHQEQEGEHPGHTDAYKKRAQGALQLASRAFRQPTQSVHPAGNYSFFLRPDIEMVSSLLVLEINF